MPSIVSTGQLTIIDQNDVSYLKLSNGSCTVPTDSLGFNGDYSGCFTTVSVVLGNQDDSEGWTYTAIPGEGVEGSLVGRTYRVTNLANSSGYVTINAEKIGFPLLSAQFSIAKAMRGIAGQSLAIVPSNQGFSFTDGQPTFPEQVISLTALKKDVSGSVQWYAEDGVILTTDPNESGSASLSGFMFGMGGAITGEVAYIAVDQLVGREQVVVTAVCDGVTATHTVVRLDASTAAAGATRNVFRGNWAAGTEYQIGDTIIHKGYGWSSKTPHLSSESITPPTYPVESNTYWTLAAVKGSDAKLVFLSASSYVVTVNTDGTLSPSTITLSATGQAVIGNPTYSVSTGTVTLTGTGLDRSIDTSSLTTDQAKIQIAWDGLVDTITIVKVKAGTDSITAVVGNEAHILPSATDGSVLSYLNSGTNIEVYEGNTLLTASATATVSAFRIGTITQAPASTITVGAVSYSGTTTTIAQHSGMAVGQDTVSLIIPITVYRANGTSVTIRKVQTLSKSKTGATGATGSTGATGATGISGLNFSEAKSLFLDPTFQTSFNSVGLYSNLANGNTIITRETKQTDSPFADSAFNLKISNIGAASPGLGGFINNFNGRASAVFVQRFIAKIPVGYSLMDASNAMGDGSTVTWLTSKNGTGKFEEYIVVRKCGATGSFSGSGYIYLNGTAGTPAVPVNWYLAYSAAYDFSAIGFGNVTGVLSNEAHTIPTDSAGNNGNFTGAATTLAVYNGATDDSANWTVTATPLAGVTGSLIGKTYSVTGMTVDTGYVDMVASRSGYSSVTKRFTLTKAKGGAAGSNGATGATGATGAQGPAVSITSSRAAAFTATDGILDGSQTDIVYTAAVSGITSPTYVWSFTGLQTNPTASTTNTQTITAAQFGTSKGATVTCTVSGTYKDTETIVRLEKSTAYAGATVGAPNGTYVGGTLAQTVESNASTALGVANAATNALANKLDKASSEILNIDTTSTTRVAGLRAGDLVWDASGNRTSGKGVAITPNGLVGHNGTATTFTVGVDGNATFAGSLSAATGTFSGSLSAATGSFAGSLSAATGTFSGTLTADAVNAVNTINIAGNAVTASNSATGSQTASTSVTVPAGQTMRIACIAHAADQWSGGTIVIGWVELVVEGTTTRTTSGYVGGDSGSYAATAATVVKHLTITAPSNASKTVTAAAKAFGTATILMLGTLR